MRRFRAAAFVALFFIQVFPAATVAWQQTRRLASGRPIILAVETRDPRDLFRGEYSTLTYEIGDLAGIEASPTTLGAPCDLTVREQCGLGSDRTVYVRLVPDATGVHRAAQVLFARPSKDVVFIAGKLQYGSLVRKGVRLGRGTCDMPICMAGRVTYGIETWYGAQGRPAQLDQAARKDVLVEARVDDDGTAVLDGIRVGGKPFAKTARLWW